MAVAGAGRRGVRLVLLVGLLACAGARAGAQEAGGTAGTLTGKLTDLHSVPLDRATVVVRNEATGVEARGITGKNGSFRFGGLEAGVYTVEAQSARLGHGQLEDVVVSAGHEARVQAAMAFEGGPEPTEAGANVAATPNATTDGVLAAASAPTLAVAAAPKVKSTTTEVESAGSDAVEPLQELAMVERRAALMRETPETDAEALDGALDAGQLQRLALSGRLLPELATENTDTVTPVAPVLTASAAAEPSPANLKPITNSGGAPVVGGGTARIGVLTADGAAASVAGSAVRAALRVIRPAVRPVLAAAGRVDPAAAVGSTTITGAEVQALPAAGRRWQDFELDAPTAAAATGESSRISLRGADWSPTETSVDGASTRMAFGGQGARPQSSGPGVNGQGGSEQNEIGQAWAGGRGSPVAEAAIREVQTAAGNAEAEDARTAGGRVNVETARGTNGLHGQGFLFDRQNTWGARNPFTQWVTETSQVAPLAPYNAVSFPVFDNFQYSSGPSGPAVVGPPESYTPPDHEMVWGVGVGSQIRRDKLFWFGALDSYHRNDAGVAMVKYPYVLEAPSGCQIAPCAPITGGFFATPTDDEAQALSSRLGLGSANPVVEGLTAYSQMLESLAGLLGPAPRTAAQWVGFGRLDWQAAERHRFTLEGTGARWNSPGGGLTRVSETYGANSFGSSKASEEWRLGRWEAFLTPNLLAVTQGSAGRNILGEHAEAPSAFERRFLGPNAYGQLPQIDVDNRYGFTIGNPSRFGAGSYPDERLYEGQETVNWVRNSLLVKAGFDLSHNFDATSLLRNQTGTYTYSDVENFASDALVFAQYGLQNPNDLDIQHGCDQTGKVWRDSGGNLRGLGNLPCYSYYSQMIGPTNWNLSTNDWAGFWTAQWQPKKLLVVAGGLRWEREQLPPPIAKMVNPQLPLTEKLPKLGNDWGPRISMALGSLENHWPVLRLGYGMYFGRTENATVETALTQTGNLNGDLNFFMRPTDDCQFCAGGAPPFPYVLSGEPGSVVKPGAVEFASNFRNPEVHQAVAAVEEELPGHVEVTASALVSLGRRLPVPIDANLTPPTATQTITYNVCDQAPSGPNNGRCGNLGLGPIKAAQITVPFYASWPSGDCPSGSQLNLAGQCGWSNPGYQGINEITSKANSTYEAAVLRVERYGRRGLSVHAHYTYSHAMDWNPGESPLDPNPADFSLEYGASDLDMRHSAAAMVVYEAPWKFHKLAGRLENGWMLSGIGQFHSGLPYTMRTSGGIAEEFTSSGSPIVGLEPGMNGSGGASRVYGVGSDGVVYDIGRNSFRYPATWKADMRLGKSFDLGQMRKLELLVESFNLFNHQNVTEIETTGYTIQSGSPPSAAGAAGTTPTLNLLTGLKINSTTGLPDPAFGGPLNVNATNFYRERQIQVGVRMRF